MNLPDVLIHHRAPRKLGRQATLGGAFFHTTNEPSRRWSMWAMVAPAGVKLSMGGVAPARIEIDLTDTETDALIEILKQARALRAAAQPVAAPDQRLAA
jgi:hypothetical protein